MLEHAKIMGISPHIIDFQNRGLNRPAQPGDSIFSTPDGMARTFPIHTLVTYATTPSHLRSSIVHQTAHELVSAPDHLSYFWSQMACEDIANEQLKPAGIALKREIFPLLGLVAAEIDTFSLTEKQLVSVFSALHSKPDRKGQSVSEPADSLWSGLMQGTVHKSMRGFTPETLKKRLANGNIKMDELQYTQDRIVHLLYTLTNGILKTHDTLLFQKLHDFLSFRMPSLNFREPQTGLQAAAGFSLNDDTLVKAILVDFTNSLFEAIYHPGSDEAGKNLQKTIENSPTGMHYLRSVRKKKPVRDQELMVFYNERYGKLGQMYDTEMEVCEFYSRILPYPENKIYSEKYELWVEYLKLFSDYATDNKLMEHPLEIVHLPDGSVRHIAMVNEDSFVAARDVFRSFTQNNAEISHPHVIESFLTYVRPKLLDTTSAGLEINNRQKREDLINFPNHGLSRMGLTIAIDQKNSQAIEARSISVDQSGSVLDIQIGNTTLHMSLNDQYELCALDGAQLTLSDDVRIWWDHVILPQLHQYICVPPEENAGYMEGIELAAGESLQAATKRIVTKRIGFLRRLGLTKEGHEKHHTQEQRMTVLEHKFLLPHLETLDLDIFNQGRPFGEKVTFVLPIERELTERPIFHLPHAYKDDEAILAGDSLLRSNISKAS